MYAIIEQGGHQFWVTPGETIRVEKIEVEKGTEITIPALWAVPDAQGAKTAEASRKASVVAEVLNQDRGPRIIVFKKRTKKAYKKTHGHRQYLTEIKIKSISFN
jgi:large subunit ribosomal protein L21